MKKNNIKRNKQHYEKMLALGNLLNVTNNQVVQKDECPEGDIVEKNIIEILSSYI